MCDRSRARFKVHVYCRARGLIAVHRVRGLLSRKSLGILCDRSKAGMKGMCDRSRAGFKVHVYYMARGLVAEQSGSYCPKKSGYTV